MSVPPGTGDTAAAIELRDVFCLHRTPEGDAAALRGLNLTVDHGEQLCVLGPSGAGKTTLLRVLAGLQPPSAGSVRVFGQDPGRLDARRRAALRHRLIGVLDQHLDGSLCPDLTVAETVALPVVLRGMGRRDARRRVGELLAAAGMTGRATARPAELSGGERQRVALCAALAHRPALLLADEPTAELDPAAAAAVAGLIAELAAAGGTTLVLVSHDAAIAGVAQRVVELRDGRLVDAGNGSGTLVVDPDGWVRLPAPLRSGAGIASAVRASADGRGLLLSATDHGPEPVATVPPALAAVGDAVRVGLRAVTVRRGGRAVLDGLSSEFAPARLTVVSGPSGVGKTTLLLLAAGLLLPEAGTVRLDDLVMSALGPEARARLRRERIGFLAQEPRGIPFLSAEENVTLAARLRGRSPGSAARGRAAFETLGLSDRAAQRVARLSAGEAQRACLATALTCAHGLLLADEPTSRLDHSSAALVTRALRAAARAGHTVICASHDPELIAAADERLALG